jgi:hypothetical protein
MGKCGQFGYTSVGSLWASGIVFLVSSRFADSEQLSQHLYVKTYSLYINAGTFFKKKNKRTQIHQADLFFFIETQNVHGLLTKYARAQYSQF